MCSILNLQKSLTLEKLLVLCKRMRARARENERKKETNIFYFSSIIHFAWRFLAHAYIRKHSHTWATKKEQINFISRLKFCTQSRIFNDSHFSQCDAPTSTFLFPIPYSLIRYRFTYVRLFWVLASRMVVNRKKIRPIHIERNARRWRKRHIFRALHCLKFLCLWQIEWNNLSWVSEQKKNTVSTFCVLLK